MRQQAGVLAIGVEAAELAEAARVADRALRVEAGLSDGLRALGEGPWAATLLSLELTGSDLTLAERLARDARAGVLLLAALRPSPELAVGAMRAGALDLLALPLDRDAVEQALRGLGSDGARVPLPEVDPGGEALVGSSPALLDVFKTVGRVAPSPATVLVTGESGTGKELVARALHGASGRRGAFVAVNCAAIPEDLLESELFGHEKGAFTGAIARKLGRFERASGGTLFLDEIGDMSLVLQAKILRALQEKEIERLGGEERIAVDVRVVAATHRDLAELIERGEFREDLYYRLAVVRMHLGPLRERPGDARELALHFAARFALEYARPLRWVSAAALAKLEQHAWPGNVRELRNAVERAVLTAPGDTLRAEDVVLDRERRGGAAGEPLAGYSPTLSMAEVEKLHLSRVLEQVGGHLGRAAEILGMHRNTVSRKAQEYGLVEER